VLDISAGENFSLVLIQMNKDIIVYRLGIDIADRYNEESNDSVRTIVNTLLIIIITITTIFLMQNLTILIILIIYF